MMTKTPAPNVETALKSIEGWQRKLLQAQREVKICERMIKEANEWITLQATGKNKDNT